MNKRLWIVFAVLVIAALSGLILWKKADTPKVNVDAIDGSKLITDKEVGESKIPDHYLGKKDSKVVVIEYEDFACVHCAQMAPTLKKIMDEYSDRVLFIYRNFSLGYPNSIVSESAAEAAYLLGGEEAYWKMHDKLFQDESTWTGQAVGSEERKRLLSEFAKEIGLDVDKFLKEVEKYTDNGIKTKLDSDKALGLKADISGTPTWIVNDKKVDSISDANVRKALDTALKEVE